MPESARYFYNTLVQYKNLEELITGGEAEGLYLECKAPATPQLTRDMKSQLAKALSGFSNTAGGVIIWGISTTKHEHSGLDVLSQIEPIGNCKLFAQQIEKNIPTLTTPPITSAEIKTIKKAKTDNRGVVVAFIPKSLGDPVQSNQDNMFYFRSGDEFSVAPYEMIKRLFAATETPDLHPVFHSGLVKLVDDGTWELPIIIQNDSSAIAEHVKVSVVISNADSCESIELAEFIDMSAMNPGQRIFIRSFGDVIHRGLNQAMGKLRVKMKVGKRPKRLLKLLLTLYANRMRARRVLVSIQLAKKGFSVTSTQEQPLY